MIQRIQTVWLLLVIISASVAFVLPFGTEFVSAMDTTAVAGEPMTALTNSIVLFIIADIILSAFIAIFTFKNRKTQKVFCILIILMSIVCAEFMDYTTLFEGENRSLGLGIIAPALSFVFSILAFSGIQKDDKLVKNLDRLR